MKALWPAPTPLWSTTTVVRTRSLARSIQLSIDIHMSFGILLCWARTMYSLADPANKVSLLYLPQHGLLERQA
jgi:hypothetical protein